MLTRQKILLRLIKACGTVKPLRLWKLAFLLSREDEIPHNAVYSFVPYLYGPYSFSMQQEITNLVSDGVIVQDDDEGYSSGNTCDLTCSLDARLAVARIVHRFENVQTPDLVSSVYRKYPWFTINARAPQSRLAVRPVADPAVYTVGYESHAVDSFLDLLLRSGIERLVDVRCNPVARRYGFHRSTLQRLAHLVGIEYRHIPQLGVPGPIREQLAQGLSYTDFFKIYRTRVLGESLSELQTAVELVRTKSTAFMCRESDRNCCHRSELARLVSKRSGLPIVELAECESKMVSSKQLKFSLQ